MILKCSSNLPLDLVIEAKEKVRYMAILDYDHVSTRCTVTMDTFTYFPNDAQCPFMPTSLFLDFR